MTTLSASFAQPDKARLALGALLDQGIDRHQMLLVDDCLLSVKLPEGQAGEVRAIVSRHGGDDITVHEFR